MSADKELRARALDFLGSIDTSDGAGIEPEDASRLESEFAAVRLEAIAECARLFAEAIRRLKEDKYAESEPSGR